MYHVEEMRTKSLKMLFFYGTLNLEYVQASFFVSPQSKQMKWTAIKRLKCVRFARTELNVIHALCEQQWSEEMIVDITENMQKRRSVSIFKASEHLNKQLLLFMPIFCHFLINSFFSF